MNPTQKQNEIIEEFQGIHNWEDRYKKIIEIGKGLKALPEDLKKEELKVKGCQSQVWIHAGFNEQRQVVFQGDSDALIVRGLVALLLRVYSESAPAQILETDIFFVEEIGLKEHLSPSRTNGLFSMVKQMKYYAVAYQALALETKS